MSVCNDSRGWWDDLERELLDCLAGHHAVAPRDLAVTLGISEGGIVSLVSQLAAAGKVNILLVEAARSAD